MHFAFDEQQHEFRSQLRALAEKQCAPAELRASWESELGWSPERYRALGEMGVTGVTVPVEHGGLGLGFTDLVLLLEEAGRSGLPEPLVDTVAVGVPLLAAVPGDAAEALRRRWLPDVAAGRAALGVAPPGTPAMVGAGAELLLLFGDGRLHALEAKDIALVPRRSIDGARHLLEVTAALPPAASVVDGAPATELWKKAADRGAWATAAVLVGVADRLLSMAAEYAAARVQFGKPIGSFQAVKHHLAGARIRLEFARPLVYAAAWALDEEEPDVPRRVAMAKSAASDAAGLAASVALQVHGAIGYTWEHDLHLWMKRAWSLSATWGDAGWHRARLLGAVDW
jgi:alkylation response protein AidB-like acyl-CoA dehydrogenase